ncbi:MAG: NIL domain-containing protein [Spirochaetaceae bacterium]
MSTKKILLNFSKQISEKPVVYHLVKDYDLVINIFRARITTEEEGYMVLEIEGDEERIQGGIDFIRSFGVEVSEAEKGLRWDSNICTHCGNCLTHCPTEALALEDSRTRRIRFDSDLCVECLNCIENCPYGALKSLF